MSPEDIATCPAFLEGLRLLDSRWFWEAHEVLEPVWMACPPNSRERKAVKALIQIANARLKARMGMNRAVARLLVEATGIIAELGDQPVLGLEADSLRSRLG
jgi:predicted metal-dependent hydrolase